MNKARPVLGSFEKVSLPKLGLYDIVAKVDTGAYSGAIHCTEIRIVRHGALRKRSLRFIPAGKPELAMETEVFIKKHVRSATGHRVKRYLIPTTIVVQGKQYDIEIGLSDRSDMKCQVLLGRRFIQEENMLVDVSLNTEYDDEGETAK